ncbi:MAG: hypothetical protein FJ278_17340 [Planctomycetes bacterium]|nr:hypothetical protein [Planctomycetota bacterium]
MREPIFSDDAQRQLAGLRVYDQRKVIEAIRAQLINADPQQESRNKFRLRRASKYADYELRIGDPRTFCRVLPDGMVYIALIGVKQGNKLIINGEEFQL